MFMHKLHPHLDLKQQSIYSLNLLQDISELMSPGKWFHISESNVFRFFAPCVMNSITMFNQDVIWSYFRM